jgi:hypothetical protein
MGDKRKTVSTTKYTVDKTGKLESQSGTSKVSVPQAGFYVNSDTGLTKTYTSQGVGIGEEDVNVYNEKNPLFGVSALSEPQYKYEWLENLWCDKLANPELISLFDTAEFESLDQESLFKPFSNSIGSLLAVETIKDSANTPVSVMPDSPHMVNSDNSMTGTLMYDSIAHVHREEGKISTASTQKEENRSSIDLAKIMRDRIDSIFNRNMALIKDPKFNSESSSMFESKPVSRADGTGFGASAEGEIKKGHAHGTNLITDTNHYDRMNECFQAINSVIEEELQPTMYSIWQYRRGRRRRDAVDISSPLEITFPVERIPSRLDGFTFDPITVYSASGDGYSEKSVATRPQTNSQILGTSPIEDD